MRILKALEEFFGADDWAFARVDNRPILRMGFQGKNGNWTCYAQSREEDEQFLFYAICPLAIPEARRTAVAEYLTRANYGMIIGNFEMDFDDGEVRFKSSVDVQGIELVPDLIRNAAYPACLMMDKYLPGLIAILGGVSAQDAIDEVEEEDRVDLTKS
jgi:hypothetical protein